MSGINPEITVTLPLADEADFKIRVETSKLLPRDCQFILMVYTSCCDLSQALREKNASIRKLKSMLFGSGTEKIEKVLPKKEETPQETTRNKAVSEEGTQSASEPARKKGHGRNGVEDYPGAERIPLSHPSLKHGDFCPHCQQGKVYEQKQPGVTIRLCGRPPVRATVYNQQKLRCNLCGDTFTAPLPDTAGDEKYDESVGAMVALNKYGAGIPFYRQEKIQLNFGVPFPASTQWEVVEKVADKIYPVFEEILRQAAQRKILYHDDTPVKILQLMKENKELGDKKGARKGMYTTGVVSEAGDSRICLFLSGRKHSGENMSDLLAKRASDLPPPIRMCDAIPLNMTPDFIEILAHCLTHARRYFVDVVLDFQEACRYVIEVLATVYKHDAEAKALKMTPEERLRYHQENSRPLMAKLHEWLLKQFAEKLAEPNSGLGKAINYMLSHWEPLTMFLRVAGAPLDNNIVERTLKLAILHRKNSLFYKTQHGAYVGDLFMSLIHTCQLSGQNPFHYLCTLQRHPEEIRANPAAWMPWNYNNK